MATFEVKYEKLDNYAKDIRSIVSTLKHLDQDIDSCRGKISTSVSAANYNVRNTLSRISNSFMDDVKTLETMAGVLDNVHELYKTTEKRISKVKVKIEEPERAEDGVAVFWDSAVDFVYDTVGGIGPVGEAVDVFWDWLNGDGDGIDVGLNITKWFANTTKAVIKEVSKTVPNWFSAVSGLGDDVFKTFGDYLKSVADDFIVGTTKTASKIGTVACSWATVLIEGVINFKGNLEEFGDNALKNARFWGETVLETAVDVTKYIVAGGVIVGGAIALGVSAPAWVVTVGSAVIVASADMIYTNISGKDFTEEYTDNVINFFEDVSAIWAT